MISYATEISPGTYSKGNSHNSSVNVQITHSVSSTLVVGNPFVVIYRRCRHNLLLIAPKVTCESSILNIYISDYSAKLSWHISNPKVGFLGISIEAFPEFDTASLRSNAFRSLNPGTPLCMYKVCSFPSFIGHFKMHVFFFRVTWPTWLPFCNVRCPKYTLVLELLIARARLNVLDNWRRKPGRGSWVVWGGGWNFVKVLMQDPRITAEAFRR